MKFGIDTFGGDHARSGVGSYLQSFTSNIPEMEDVEFELFGSELDRYTYNSVNGIPFTSVRVPDSLLAERAWHYTRINNFAQKAGYNCVLYPGVERVLPISFRVPGVAVVNSIIYAKLKEKNDTALKIQLKQGLHAVQKIVAPSQVIRMDLIKSGVNPAKIEIIHNGIDHKLFYPELKSDEETVNIQPFAIKKPYFIYGSRLSGPEKKHVELIKAFTLFKERTHLPHRLVLAGSDDAYADQVHKAAFHSSAATDIFLTGFFPHESFPLLYAGAEACIFPSTNEGVGLPVLEAMATGVPVACSKSCALPEAAGDAAVYFDSDNVEEIAACMEKIVTDSDLRQTMISKGLTQAAKFSWQKTVEQTIGVLKSVAK